MEDQGLSAAASLILLKGPKKQAGDAMKLTIMELVAGGQLLLGHDQKETVAWIPDGAPVPGNRTLLSLFSVARQLSSEGDPRTVLEIAIAARSVSTAPSWLTELYDADLMHTRKRALLRDVPELTAYGETTRRRLVERAHAQDAFSASDGRSVETLLGGARLAKVRDEWPDVDAFVKTLNRAEGSGPAAGPAPAS